MAQGLHAVKAALIQDFGNIEIQEDYDSDTRDSILHFEANFLPYQVIVTHEYDNGYTSGQLNVDLTQLGALLRSSQSGKIRIFRDKIISK